MVDPTSDHGEDVDESNAPTCVVCDEPIVRSPTHQVVTWVEDGRIQHRDICDEDCRAEWEDDRPVDAGGRR